MTNRIPLHTGKQLDLPRERHDPADPLPSGVDKPVENRADRRRRAKRRRRSVPLA